MKKLLAIDTSTRALSLALAEGNPETVLKTSPKPNVEPSPETGEFTLVAEMTEVLERQHGETLAPEVAKILSEAGWVARDLQGIIIGVGPGSYTGMRIGVTFAKTWAHSIGLELYATSSLALMAGNLAGKDSGLVIPIMDARRGTAYTGLYRDGNMVTPDLHTDFLPWLQAQELEDEVTFIGTDIEEFIDGAREALPQVTINVLTGDAAYPRASNAFGQVALQRVEDISTLAPNYAHETLAEKEWRERQDDGGASADESPLVEIE